jgi:acyl carrier protein
MDDVLKPSDARSSSGATDTITRVRKTFAEALNRMPTEHTSDVQMFDEAASLDSIAVLEFLNAIENEFGIVIEQEVIEFEFLRDFTALATYIDERLRHPGAHSGSEPRRLSARAKSA